MIPHFNISQIAQVYAFYYRQSEDSLHVYIYGHRAHAFLRNKLVFVGRLANEDYR